MDAKYKALFIGRFQPVHNGHADALKQILGKEENVLIAVGSAQNGQTSMNPFSYEERLQMLEKALGWLKIDQSRYKILPAKDINDDAKWVGHLEQILPCFEKVYTGSPLTKKLFLADGKYEVCDLKFRVNVSATDIRKLMREKKSFENLVPPPVFTILKKLT